MNTLLTIHATSLAIGFLLGLAFYLVVAVIAALVLAKNTDEDNDTLYEKKLRDAGYNEDVFY